MYFVILVKELHKYNSIINNQDISKTQSAEVQEAKTGRVVKSARNIQNHANSIFIYPLGP